MSAQLNLNICTDPGDPESTDITIQGICVETDINQYYGCQSIGGTYPLGSSGKPYPEPEWVLDFPITQASVCDNGLFSNGNAGSIPYCTRVANGNFGDPLICALRDYQCNGLNELSNPSCFSDNNFASTCNKDFRAIDTTSSVFLLNQFCLGNIPDSIYKFGTTNTVTGFTGCTGPTGCSESSLYPFCGGVTGCFPTPGSITDTDYLPFYALWTDPTNPNDNNNKWKVLNTPPGTKYRTSSDILKYGSCDYDFLRKPICQTSEWTLGQPGAPTTYYPQPDYYTFGGAIPPCQQIFWRTLYGNQPVFQNNYYKSADSINSICPDGSNICANTSIPPQAASCGAIPFGGAPTTVGLDNAGILLENAVQKYYNLGGDLTNDLYGSPDFNNFVYSICQEYPYLCGNFLQKTVCSNMSKDDVVNNPNMLKWCGCYLTSQSYVDYVDNLGVSKECSPFCNRPNVIPLYDTDTKLPKYCNQSVCIIDDVTITLAKTTLESEGLAGGNINFNQICNSCSSNGGNGVNSNNTTNSNSVNASTTTEGVVTGNASINCQCILKNFTLTTIGSNIEGGINISQACNGNAKCYSSGSNNNGNLLEIDCHGSSTGQNSTIAKAEAELLKKAEKTSNYWIILFAIILIALIMIAWLIIAPRGIPEKDLIYTKKIMLPEPQAPPIRNIYNLNQATYPQIYGFIPKNKPNFY
jgi:hypothetical protein